MHSWRTLFVDHWHLYNFREHYDFEKAWNARENVADRGAESAPDVLVCPATRAREQRLPPFTDYVAVIGENTMWRGGRPVTPASDGSDDDKILVIEVVNSNIVWLEPRDLTLDQALENINPKVRLGIGSSHRCGINYVTVAGKVRTLPHDIDRESLRKLLVRDVGENGHQ